jgi:pyruvate,water dikinase
VTALISHLTGVRSAEAGRALVDLADEIRRDKELSLLVSRTQPSMLFQRLSTFKKGRALRRHLEAFLAEHGHSAAEEFELAAPRWRDDPTMVLEALQAHIRAGAGGTCLHKTITRQQAMAQVKRQLSWLQQKAFRLLLRQAQTFTVMRENLKYYFVLAHGHLRDLYLAQAQRLATTGRLTCPDDVFFLTTSEVDALAQNALTPEESQQRIERRRQAWERAQQTSPPFCLEQLTDGRIRAVSSRHASDDEGARCLRGFGASPGVYTGRARIVLSADEGAALNPGEVLITRATSPGWSPLLLRAGALVTEIGGTLSHGAIIAREYGVPAVLNVIGATEQIHDGQLVKVDGQKETVRIID